MENTNEIIPFWKILIRDRRKILFLSLPLLLMDAFMKLLSTEVNYFNERLAIPNLLFSIMWIGIIITISLSLKGNLGRIFYALVFLFVYVLFLTHHVYYPFTGFFFSFNLLESASEGKSYILDTVKTMSFFNVTVCFFCLVSGIYTIIKFPKSRHFHSRRIIVFLSVFVILHSIAPSYLGESNSTLQWDTWRNPRNIYENFTDGNKNIKICGLYEYSFRDLYMTFFKPDEPDNPEELKFVEKLYSTRTMHKPNKYTGIFEGKNVIFVQMEGLDSWLLTKEDTPTIHSMLDNSIVFNNHYSYYTGGGSTFNSELAVNTGFITPISFTRNAYSFNYNYYPHSLPHVMKERGYSANAFHMNDGEYYMRDTNYRNWGYDAYNSLIETNDYKDADYNLDRELILNKTFYDKMFKQGEPFLHYIITYTPHTPFSLDSSTGKAYSKKAYGEGVIPPDLPEEEVARLYASETDYMMKLLLEALKENNLIDNTVIVAFSDHYLYTLKDKSILEKYKETDDNRINNTPFFIWSKDMKRVDIGKVNSQIDILPTVLNMLGVRYYEEHYVGRDIMDELYVGYVFFSDYSWYDGVNYIQYSDSVGPDVIQKGYIDKTNDTINNLIKKNDFTLKYDYFKRIQDAKKK